MRRTVVAVLKQREEIAIEQYQGKTMVKVRFDIPDYEEAMTNFISAIFEGFFALHPLFGNIPRQSTSHSGPIRNVRGSKPLDQIMPEVTSVAVLNLDTVRHSDIEDYTRVLHEFAEASNSVFAQEFFKGMVEITDAVGNTVDAGGKPFSFDLYNDLIDKMQIEFDELGKPILPKIVPLPGVPLSTLIEKIKNIKPTQEQKKRFSRIIAGKKAEYHAQKRIRRLS